MTNSYIQIAPSRMTARFLRGASVTVITSALMAGTAHAQDVPEEEDVVVTTGIRQSLENSQNIKRNADTFVDSITASDIGALPDRSVLEAIQRVPGVSISRFEGGNDPDHFQVEGSGVVIRGLDYVRSEFNGRDAFSANSGRALGFQDVSPELVGGVDVFKNQTADMVEGGISGVVNLRTLKPFDRSERTIAATIEGTYSDLAEEFSPSGSALLTDRWDTKHGEFGLLASGSYSNLKSRSDGVQVSGLYPYNAAFDGQPDPTVSTNLIAPTGINIRSQDFDRDRIGLSVAGQWASNDGRSLATAEFIRSESTNAWSEHTLQQEEGPGDRANLFAQGDFASTSLPAGTTVCQNRDACDSQIGGSQLFQSGVITADYQGWVGGELGDQVTGSRLTQFSRISDTKAVTSDYSFNYKFTPNDNLKINLDAQYIKSTTKNKDISAFNAQFLNQIINLNGAELNQSGYADPTVEFIGLDINPFVASGELTASEVVADPRNTFYRAVMDHFEDSEGDELAFRGDVQYDFNDDESFIKGIRAGYRFAERDQLTRFSRYNWGNVSEVWKGGGAQFASNTPNLVEGFTFDNFRRGGVLQGQDTFQFVRTDLLQDYRSLVDAFSATDAFPSADNHLRGFGGRNADGSLNFVELEDRFLPGEITDAVETTSAIYARVDFGSTGSSGMSFDGNFGVRVIKTDLKTEGAAQFQPSTVCDITTPEPGQPQLVLTAQAAIACDALNSPDIDIVADTDRTDVLPSFNLKVDVNDDVIMRFAAARAMSRPDVGNLRAYRNTSGQFSRGPVLNPDSANPTQNLIFDRYVVSGGNPALEPVLATNLDASLEWYFSDVGSLTGSVFYKKLDNVIVNGEANGESLGGAALAGSTYNGPQNNGEGSLQGFELAYQQFYDFLPGWASGFGVQANYTYIDQNAFSQSTVQNNNASGLQVAEDSFTPSDLEKLSKHTVNLVGLYENDKIEARLAYNWRSDFLLTTLDVISRLPVYNESTGQLDASLKYQFTDQFQLGIQGVNLTSEVTETTVQINPRGDRFLRSRFENDRRVSIVGSFTF